MKRLITSAFLLLALSSVSFALNISTPVVISTPQTIPVGITWNVVAGGSITINSGGSLTVYGDLVTQPGRPITVNSGGRLIIQNLANFDTYGILTVQYGGTATIAAGAFSTVNSGGTVTVYGNLIIYSYFTVNSGGTVNINSNGIMTVGIDGAVTFFTTAILNINTGGRLNINGGNQYVEGVMNVAANDVIFVQGNGELHIVATGSAVVGANAAITVGSGSLFIVETNGSATMSGDIMVNFGGTLTVDGSMTVSTNGSIIVNGTLNVGYDLTVQNTAFATVYGTCNVKSGGIFTVYSGGLLDVYGFLVVNPRGYVNVYEYCNFNVHPQALVTLKEGLSIISLYYGASMHLISGPTGFAKIAIEDRAILRFYDSIGTLTIDEGSFITMSGPASGMPASCQVANLSWAAGTIECHEPHPFRGKGNLHRLIINFYDDFEVASTDSLIFKYGGTWTFDCTGTYQIPIDGYLELRGIVGDESYIIAGCVDLITLSTAGAHFKVTGAQTIGALPNITAIANTKLEFLGAPATGLAILARPQTGISTLGSFSADYAHFHGPIDPGWYGIKFEGPSLFTIDHSSIMEAGTFGNNALELYNATNPANAVRRTDIITPIFPPGYAGNGIWLHSSSPLSYSSLLINCCQIHGFDKGLWNEYGDISMSGSKLFGNLIGMQNDYASAYILSSCFNASRDRGLVVTGLPPRTGFGMYQSLIVNNVNWQLDMYNNATVSINDCMIYYQIGDNTTPLVRANDVSVANVQNNWWGVYPTTPMQFNAVPPALINHLPELTLNPGYSCGCMMWPKESAQQPVLPSSVSLSNYPNPFNPSTVIEFTLPHEMPVTLTVYTITGEEVLTLVNETKSAGTHRVTFTAPRNSASGMYLYELATPDGSSQGRMLLTK